MGSWLEEEQVKRILNCLIVRLLLLVVIGRIEQKSGGRERGGGREQALSCLQIAFKLYGKEVTGKRKVYLRFAAGGMNEACWLRALTEASRNPRKPSRG